LKRGVELGLAVYCTSIQAGYKLDLTKENRDPKHITCQLSVEKQQGRECK